METRRFFHAAGICRYARNTATPSCRFVRASRQKKDRRRFLCPSRGVRLYLVRRFRRVYRYVADLFDVRHRLCCPYTRAPAALGWQYRHFGGRAAGTFVVIMCRRGYESARETS